MHRWLVLVAMAIVAGCVSPREAPMKPRETAEPPPFHTALTDPEDAREMRRTLVARIVARYPGLDDKRVRDAMLSVPRHWFVDAPLVDAYRDRPFPIGHGQTISQPTIVMMMSHALHLDGSERVLEVGTGSGYQAAVLSVLAWEVFSIEIVAPLASRARDRLAAAGYSNVQVRTGDGYKGWPEQAPFDRVIVTAAPPEMPQALLDQLRIGGILIAPIGGQHQTQRLERWTRTETGFSREDLGPVVFVPMVHEDR